MFFSEAQQQQITQAIQDAEKQTSGEIKVHIEEHCPLADPFERAKEVFFFLALDNTAQRNGVLFYLSVSDRKFAILGDAGINEKVGPDFWEKEKLLLLSYLKEEKATEGFCLAIAQAGESLKKYFPVNLSDENELSDDISFG